MDRSTIAYLLLASSLLINIMACKTVKPVLATDQNAGCTAVINSRIHTATYNTQIDFFGKHISGLLIFKSLSDTVERVVLITETGFKFFDFEFTPHSFVVRYCMSSLNKKIVIKTLQRDLGFLTDFSHKNITSVYRSDTILTHRVLLSGGKSNYYTTDTKCVVLKSIETGTQAHKTVTLAMDSFQNGHPTAIRITDHPAHLHISMKEIER